MLIFYALFRGVDMFSRGDPSQLWKLQAETGYFWLEIALLVILPLGFWFWRNKEAAQVKLFSWQNGVLILTTLLFALIGSRTLFLYQHKGDYEWRLLTSWQSGFVLYGGLIAGVLTGAIYTKMRGGSILQIGDIAAPSMMLGLLFGRLGCLLNGCCWGKPTELPWAIRFPQNSEAAREIMREQIDSGKYAIDMNAPNHLPIHPTQIYESLAALVIFFGLSWYWKNKKKHAGEVLLLLGVAYPLWRFLVEFIRDQIALPNVGRKWVNTWAPYLSLGIGILCAVGFFLLRTRPAPLPAMASDAKPEPPAAEVKPPPPTNPA